MKITTVLFDLDGTLLPMDQDLFMKAYFKGLCVKMAPYGYAPEQLIDAVWAGTKAMVMNDGSRTCEAAFWDKFSSILGEEVMDHIPAFDEFYHLEFQSVQKVCGFNPEAAKTVRALKAAGYRVVLATNPLFPAIATESRTRWAGLEPEEFELVTTYEAASYCKPNPA
ncbi:MAG: HAD family hydrolase, partial [Clostridia bacterium]|nr:HAD family hydrolase [Clostridia bacterium]